jgi:hypothetical protein
LIFAQASLAMNRVSAQQSRRFIFRGPGSTVSCAAARFLARSITLVVLAGLLSGCVAGFVYNRLDWLVSWYAGGFVTLDDAQEQQLRNLVASTLAWHRRTQLPRYVQLLDDLDRDTDGPMSPELVQRRFGQMEAAMDDFLGQVTPQAAVLLRSLRPEQIRDLFENIEDDNEDFRKEYSGKSSEARLQRRGRAAVRALQRFTGTLNEAQRTLVGSQLSSMYDVAPDWLEHRRVWQAHFRVLLDGSLQGREFEAALRELLLRPNQFDQTDYRRKADENRRQAFRMLAAVSETLTSDQRKRVGEKMQEYSRILTEIANQT